MVLAIPASSVVGRSSRDRAPTRGGGQLTDREREVLVVAAEGLTARQSRPAWACERTITTHLARIYGKLGVGSRMAAIRMASQSGLVSVGASE
jgi:DNA-binding NarL/FixJ family response regulator